jgi:hypothetical protein
MAAGWHFGRVSKQHKEYHQVPELKFDLQNVSFS